ncbi:helix-turn-helix domain-containing protein [Actinoplanes sichuanensis]|uniref:Helix-turn-helix transcriptional regulator n=1 Tax=Actinoplanes sichuanensis TaxID=512349 RepID=A0ABW4AM78_9ACTN|nr:helix-turn-helix transcriptional regulator [Actinoplanes sichuanensis]
MIGRDDELRRIEEHLRVLVASVAALRTEPPRRPARPVAPPRREARPGPVDWAALSPREREIADLVGQALTNRQIARRTGISPHTVNFHLRQIFQKLGLVSRVELVALWHQRPTS